MILRVYESATEMATAVCATVLDAISAHPSLVLGLPTGRTPIELYRCLVEGTAARGIDWSHVRTFNLDEFVGLGAGDGGSYRRYMHSRLFDHINLPATRIGFLDGLASDLTAECARYDDQLRAAGGLDLLLLGIGRNGHIGFNEPGEHLLARTHVVRLDTPTRAANALWFEGDTARVPCEALTMGMAALLGARSIVLLASGDSKAEALRAMLHGPITTQLPASFLQLHPHVCVAVDRSLADQLS